MLQNMPRKVDRTVNVALIEWRRQNAKQIEAAVKLFGREARNDPEARNDIETALIEIQFEYRQMIGSFQFTKLEKKAAKKLLPSLRRIRRLMMDSSLPLEIKLFYDAIKPALASCEKIAASPPAKNPRKEAELKRIVIQKAADLISKLFHREARRYGSVRGDPHAASQLVKLATILYGDPNVNLRSQVAAFVREARKAK